MTSSGLNLEVGSELINIHGIQPASSLQDNTPRVCIPSLPVNMSNNVVEKLVDLQTHDRKDAIETLFLRSSDHQEGRESHASKQVFAPLLCLPYENNLVYCYILSVWDNIIGPQTVQVWKRVANPNKSTKSLPKNTKLLIKTDKGNFKSKSTINKENDNKGLTSNVHNSSTYQLNTVDDTISSRSFVEKFSDDGACEGDSNNSRQHHQQSIRR